MNEYLKPMDFLKNDPHRLKLLVQLWDFRFTMFVCNEPDPVGNNIIGAQRDLRKSIENSECMGKFFKSDLNPPNEPHQDGTWKRLVGSFKIELYTVWVHVE